MDFNNSNSELDLNSVHAHNPNALKEFMQILARGLTKEEIAEYGVYHAHVLRKEFPTADPERYLEEPFNTLFAAWYLREHPVYGLVFLLWLGTHASSAESDIYLEALETELKMA